MCFVPIQILSSYVRTYNVYNRTIYIKENFICYTNILFYANLIISLVTDEDQFGLQNIASIALVIITNEIFNTNVPFKVFFVQCAL